MRGYIGAAIKKGAHDAVKTKLSIESMRVLDGATRLAKLKKLSRSAQLPRLKGWNKDSAALPEKGDTKLPPRNSGSMRKWIFRNGCGDVMVNLYLRTTDAAGQIFAICKTGSSWL